MSETKPAAWIDPEYLPSLRHELTGTILRLNKDGSETMPLYTAEQLAEAVAAERDVKERAVKDVLRTAMQRLEIETVLGMIEDRLKTNRAFLSPEYTLVCKGFADNLKSDFEAIRSAAK